MRRFLFGILSLVMIEVVALKVSASSLLQREVSPLTGQTALSSAWQRTMGSKPLNWGKLSFPETMKHSAGMPLERALRGEPRKSLASYAEANNLPEIYGCCIYTKSWNADNAKVGLYQLPQSANGNNDYLFETISANYGGVLVDDVYVVTNMYSSWSFLFITINRYDVETGELLSYYDGDKENLALGIDVDPTTGQVYGIFYNSDASGYRLATIEYGENSCTMHQIAAVTEHVCALAFDREGQAYIITRKMETQDGSSVCVESNLCKIDKNTGAVTKIGTTGQLPQYISDAVIDKRTGRMYWTVNTADSRGRMCEVDLATGRATELFYFENDEEYAGMFIPDPKAEDKAPSDVTGVKIDFYGSTLSGVITAKAPTTLFDGTPASGPLTAKVFANGEEIYSGQTSYGADMSLNVSVPAEGLYTFEVLVANEVGNGPATKVRKVYVGKGIPAATTATLAYENGKMNLSWLPVETTVNGGYLDKDKLTYTVTRMPDNLVVGENISGTTFSETFVAPENYTVYYYQVVTNCDGLNSEPALSNKVVLGDIIPPYTSDFENEGLEGWTVIDGNDDGKLWKVRKFGDPDEGEEIGYDACVRVDVDELDDWLFTPAIKVEAGKTYVVSFDTYTWDGNEWCDEKLEVKFGYDNSVEGMNGVIMEPTTFNNIPSKPLHIEQTVKADRDGKLYIGFHAISDDLQLGVCINHVEIQNGVSAAAPREITDLEIIPDPTGAYKTAISFKAPTLSMDDEALTSLTKIEILRGEKVIKTFDNPTPGAIITYTDEVGARGEVTYTVVAYNESGQGLLTTRTVNVGFDVPADVQNITIAPGKREGEAIVNWDAVTEDINGLPYGEGMVKYNVYLVTPNKQDLIATVEGTSYAFMAVASGKQEFIQCAVQAVTDAGNSATAVTKPAPIGKPYIGMFESFANCAVKYIFASQSIGGGGLNLYDDSEYSDLKSVDGDNGFLAFTAQYNDSGAALLTGLISLADAVNPAISFYTYNVLGGESPDINEITVEVKESGATDFQKVLSGTVKDLTGNADGWGLVSASLSKYAGKTIQVKITAISKIYGLTTLDNLRIGSQAAKDLTASVTAPQTVNVGSEYTVDVVVENVGTEIASNYSVELYADDKLQDTKTGTNLRSGSSKTYSFQMTMSAVADKPISIYAVVVFSGDEVESNNRTTAIEVSPKLSNLPAATNLSGEKIEGGVKLSWLAPDLNATPTAPITYDFENGDSFADKFGSFIFVDADKSEVGGFANVNVPGIIGGTTKGSFWLWDNDVLSIPGSTAHSGSKYLFALYRNDLGTSDEWVISPELSGAAQEISFYAKSYDGQYPEKIELYYSMGSTDIKDFVKIEGVAGNVPADWTLYKANVPAGAKRFAIRSCAEGAFMLMVDDVTLIPAVIAEGAEIEGYEVYRNGVKIADTGDCEYIDTALEEADNTYVVLVKYNLGLSAPSNSVTIKDSGVTNVGNTTPIIITENQSIVIIGAEGMRISIAQANGMTIFSGIGEMQTTVNVGIGLYIVNVEGYVRKVLVK